MVVRAHLGDESANARSGRQLGQLFEQAGADAAAVQGIVDDERDLGHLRLAEAVVCPHRDNEPIPRTDQRPTCLPIRVEVAGDQAVVQHWEPVEAMVKARR